MPINIDNDNSNNKKVTSSTTIITEILAASKKKQEQQLRNEQDYTHKGENCHSKNTENQSSKELNNECVKAALKLKIKDELKKHKEEQSILLKENKQNIIDFILDNKDSIRIDDLKIYEPIYKCYRQIENCQICKSLTNIICTNCSNYNNEVWLCVNHWQQHAIKEHN